jgi:hypothetical protein
LLSSHGGVQVDCAASTVSDVMSTPIGVAFIVLVCILLGSVAGIVLSRTLSERRFSDQTKDVVRMTAGTVGTMTALVLGLVLASERSAFDAEAAAVKQGAINIFVLDRMLSQYGPETTDVRKLVLLTFWLTIVLMSFGLFAPPNLVVAVTLLIGAFAVASSVFLIMELDDPFSGVVKVSGEPVAYSLSVLGK